MDNASFDDFLGGAYVGTATASSLLDRRQQTLRKWRSCGTCPVAVIKVNGRLYWSVADIKSLFSRKG